MERTTPMAEHATKRKPQKGAAVKKDGKSALAKKVANHAVANTEEERGARIVVLTDDPRRSVVIVPGCHIGSMRHRENAYFFEDGNELVGMIVEGGTVEYQPGDRTYVVRLTNGRHTAE
jgi:hypothetical protein